MLEESKMDKKSINRSSQPQSRASAVDCKKNTDLTNKPWPRNNKKREGPGGAPKNELYRKNSSAQRGRGQVDRRPRPRGSTTFSVGGTENTGIENEDEPEIGSIFVPGIKKQNLNHLLNFMYPTRKEPDRRGPVGRRSVQPLRYHGQHDLYLRAYCQFVVKEDGNYKANLLDPDIPIKWEHIEEIVVRSTGRSECPICLGTPIAGRAGLCGHVYCWACILHYAATHDKQPPPCPVCMTPIRVKDMKPTTMIQWESAAEEVTMRLVRRLRGSTIVEVAPPRGQLTESTKESIMPLDNIHKAPYSKFFSATKEQISDILGRERKEIQDQILAEIDTSELIYLEQALEELKNKEANINKQFEQLKVMEEIEESSPIVHENLEVNKNKFDWFDVTEEGAACMDIVQEQIESLEIIESNLNPDVSEFYNNDVNEIEAEEFPLIDCSPQEEDPDPYLTDIDKQNQAKYFYFYQAEDGQQLFLNSLNVRMLNASWGTLAAAPLTIRGRVLHRETLSLAEQTRKHMPYTAHLPLYCSFDIVELDLQPPYVTTGAIKNFSAELERRSRIRARHERDERRRERAYRRAMEGPPRPDFSSELLFPPAAPLPNSPPLMPTLPTTVEGSPTSLPSPSPSGLSFAKMASTSGTWRVRAAAPPPPVEAPREGAPPRALNLSDAIEAAFKAPAKTTANKKKKNKQKLLFATGMHSAA